VSSAPSGVIEIRGLRFSYGRRAILKGIDLDIPRGKVIGILGSSGSGKTTLLQLIGGALRPAAGSVRVFGEAVHALDSDALYAMRRRMGMMFQRGGLFSDLSVFENVAFPIREHTNLPETSCAISS
jgi:phospholipid/cholesterol/gamma-HCH transport system ATP-binding protein